MDDRDPTTETDDHGSDPASEFAYLDDVQAWRIVRLGLGMMYWSLIAASVLAVSAVIAVFIGPSWDSMNPVPFTEYAIWSAFGASIFLACVGQCLCCAAPIESGARRQAQGAAICLCVLVLSLGTWFLLSLTRWDERILDEAVSPQGRHVLFVMGGILLFASYHCGHALFLRFLRDLGHTFRDATLPNGVDGYFALYWVVLGLWVAFLVLGLIALIPSGSPVVVFAHAMLLGFAPFGVFMLGTISLVLWVVYVHLIGHAFTMIREALRRAGC